MKEQKQESIVQYLEALSSKSPIPGGGGAAALSAAFAFSLGMMVGNLTLGKKSYADFQDELEGIMKSLEEAKQKVLALEARDEEVFLPLSKAYSLPRKTEEEQKIYRETMENCLIEASLVPTELLELCVEKIPLFARLQEKGSRIALSDVGVGVGFLKTAMESAILNVYINTKSMQNQEIKAKREAVCDRARTGISSLEEIIQAVENVVRGA